MNPERQSRFEGDPLCPDPRPLPGMSSTDSNDLKASENSLMSGSALFLQCTQSMNPLQDVDSSDLDSTGWQRDLRTSQNLAPTLPGLVH